MENIKKEVERLYKIFKFDKALFVITSVTIMREMIVKFLSLNSKKFEFDELLKLLDINLQFSFEYRYYIKAKTLLERLNKYYVNYEEILIGQVSSDEKIEPILEGLYELSNILKRKDYSSLIEKVFYEFDNSFIAISQKYNGLKNIEGDIENKVDINFSGVNSTLMECKKSLKKFKNSSLKYEETHKQYQNRYWALSEKQELIINEIYSNLNGVHLVEGIAGSGKSLVLLKIFGKINEELDNQSIFLTYNKSLVRFNKKGLKTLNFNEDYINKIRTFDSFCIYLLERIANKKIFLRDTNSNFEDHFIKIIEEAVEQINNRNINCEIDPYIIFNEIEYYINPNYLNKIEYINSSISTKFSFKGNIYTLKKEEKEQIWMVNTIFIDLLESRKYLPRNYAMVFLLKFIEKKKISGIKNYIIVDEVQDLSLVEILLLNKLSRRSLILAGDINQSIYQSEAAWEKNKLPFLINRYQLKYNYRNSNEIRIFSEAYLNSFNKCISKGSVIYDKSCTGLKPRLFMRSHVEDTLNLMIDKIKIDICEFNLNPSDILIVCVSQYILEEVERKINLPICRLKNTNFDEKKINISSMYSSKGTGFPYMYFFLSNKIYIPYFYNNETRYNLMKKLIYVSITRSMNSLNIFIPKSKTPLGPINNLIQLFNRI